MLRGVVASLALLGLGACDSAIVQDTSREAAKRVVTPIVVDKFPGRNTEGYTNCIIDNATTDEIFSLAKAAVTGADQGTINTVIGISTRPETVKCILQVELTSRI
ncbi:MAG TPA: succinate dehydrogenase [Rhodobacteraceae bacterium]|nr:succinate dehydrogenase [Paracoccaceae bacterium]